MTTQGSAAIDARGVSCFVYGFFYWAVSPAL